MQRVWLRDLNRCQTRCIQIPSDNPQSLAEAVSTLEKVKLTCGLTTEQSKAMFDHLAVESNLKSLEIMCTDFSSVAVQTLAMVVSENGSEKVCLCASDFTELEFGTEEVFLRSIFKFREI